MQVSQVFSEKINIQMSKNYRIDLRLLKKGLSHKLPSSLDLHFLLRILKSSLNRQCVTKKMTVSLIFF